MWYFQAGLIAQIAIDIHVQSTFSLVSRSSTQSVNHKAEEIAKPTEVQIVSTVWKSLFRLDE